MSQDFEVEELGSSQEERSSQLVPVNEAIRYRKRAQAAEQEAEVLKRKLQEQQSHQRELQEKLQKIQVNRDLTQALVQAGAVDLEVALLLAEKKFSQADENGPADVGKIVDHLRRDRPGLFAGGISEPAVPTAGLTAGVRSRVDGRRTALARLAERASHSGSRKDIQEYLRLRRSLRSSG